MALSLQDYVKDTTGKLVNNGQCWGLAQDYLNRVLGGGSLSTQGGTHPGFAIGSLTGYSNNGLSKWFKKAGATSKAVPGSLAFWGWGTNSNGFSALESHVAVVLADNGDSLKVLSQNSGGNGATQVQTLPKTGLAGYLVPNNSPTSTDSGNSSGGNAASGTDFSTTPLGLFASAIGLGDQLKPGTPLSSGLGNFVTNVFLPETWVRVLAFYIGVGLLIAGAVFIIMDYKKSGDN